MSKTWFRPSSWAGVLTILITLMSSGVSQAEMVHSGYDLFHTDPGSTSFMSIAFQGVPIGQFDFGDGKGLVDTFQTDTIVHRLDDVTVSGGTTRLQLVDLQLRTVNQVDLGAGLGYYYVTLQSRRGPGDAPLLPEPLTTGQGTMAITFDNPGIGGNFNTTGYSVYFDIRFGSLTGPIVMSANQDLSGPGTWVHEPPPNTLLIDGVNSRLNGTNHDADFFISGTLHTGPHGVAPAAAPEPTSLMLAGLGSLFALGYRSRKGRK